MDPFQRPEPKTFHPCQKAKHLLNRLKSNTDKRNAVIAQKVRADRTYQNLMEELSKERAELRTEGEELLTELTEYPRTMETVRKSLF